MVSNFKFPILGWETGWSDSYGADEFFRGMNVVFKKFPASERIAARDTCDYLTKNGISTAILAELTQLAEKNYIYVFFDQKEFFSNKDKLFRDVEILVTPKRKNELSAEEKITFAFTMITLGVCGAYITNSTLFFKCVASMQELLKQIF